jgi:acyl-CoA synthetase (AMP-forming)/AMP-acid ligase II
VPGFNLADMFEQTVDAVPDRTALVTPDGDVTYRQLDEQANRVAHHLAGIGIGPGDHVAIDACNSAAWIETLLGVFKLRAAAINVNYRYLEDELAYLLDNSDTAAVVLHRRFGPCVEAACVQLSTRPHLLVVDDDSGADLPVGALDYTTALTASSPDRGFGDRSGDDRFVLYTGGTTGLPKGVVWRHEDLFFAALCGAASPEGPPERADELAARAPDRKPVRWLLPAPMHHAGGQFGTIGSLLAGNTLVLWTGQHFDAAALWSLVEEHRVQRIGIVGDAMARPLADELTRRSYDTSSLQSLGSGGAVFSPTVRQQLRELLPRVVLADSLGSTETGVDAVQVIGDADLEPRAPRFQPGPDVQVFDEQLRAVPPGSGVVGMVGRRGHIPLGYYGDPQRSAATFPLIGGERWSIPGDHAVVEADGTMRLLGRGSVSINTGGEKVYPEEVEATLKAHPDVLDAVVVGVPDAHWGELVAAVVQLRPDAPLDPAALERHCRDRLASYKVPKRVEVVDLVVRNPSGKPDYRWASKVVSGPSSSVAPSSPSNR